MPISRRQRRMMYGWGWVVLPSTRKDAFGNPEPSTNPRLPHAARLLGPYPAQIVWQKSRVARYDEQTDNLTGTIILGCTSFTSTAVMGVHMAPTTTPGTALSYTYPIEEMTRYFEPFKPASIGFHHLEFRIGNAR